MCQSTTEPNEASVTSSDHRTERHDSGERRRTLRPTMRVRRGKRDKTAGSASTSSTHNDVSGSAEASPPQVPPRKRPSKALQKHGQDAPSGGAEALLPSLIGVGILAFGIMAKMGFRGRATVAGIDLGTTNSVICVQAPSKGVGDIQCIPDPLTNSPIVPSVVSFLEISERPVGPSSKVSSLLDPHPTAVVVGQAAKRRIDSHPHHTLYQAKRVLGRPSDDPAMTELREEVEFAVTADPEHGVVFGVPETSRPISPQQVGSYVVSHLMRITETFLGHDNIKSAVICVPAKFNAAQKLATYQAFRQAGVTVARVVEEPTAAALAYGLNRKEGVDHILVYDFGGGTLDVSLLHVSDGFVDVMGSDGDDRLGGADFDAAIAHFLLEHRHGQAVVSRVSQALQSLVQALPSNVDLEDQLSASCTSLQTVPLCTVSSFHTLGEQLKIALSAYPDGNGTVEAECLGFPEDYVDPDVSLEGFCTDLTTFWLSLTSREYEQSVQALYARSISPVTRLLNDLNLRHDDVDEVVMVGGTTRIPQIRKLVQQALPSASVNTHIDPDITVAYGAASVID
jgi:molecular chaperone DnaK (HSP70)